MNTVTVVSIETKPTSDPYHADTGGISHTVLKLYEDGEIHVVQDYDDNSTPSDVWHGRTLTWFVPGHPTEAAMREFLEAWMDDLQAVHDAHSVKWNGHNHSGGLADFDAYEKIENRLDRGLYPTYEYWAAEDWLDQADDIPTDPEQFEEYARTIEADALSENIIIENVLDYLRKQYFYT